MSQNSETPSSTDQTVSELADYLVSLLDASRHDNRRIIIAVSGTPGSGKTYLSGLLCSKVNSRCSDMPAVVFPLDGFHLTKAQLAAMDDPEMAMKRRGSAWTFDAEGFVATVQRIHEQAHLETLVPSFDHAIGDPVADEIAIRPDHRLVIVEGLYAHVSDEPWAQLDRYVSERWWVEPRSREASIERLLKRHIDTGLSADRDAAALRFASNDSLNAQYAETCRLPPTRIILN
ncbi:hypothetical protein J3B02_002029 [Coemansia erecta]|uniref:P-loop containing nucleoside triphosphate hydrolase protein n=1 Tax=Coemansia asiatica TaxID=1052880 RepID=A0A9W7XG67_9FUNG|nr:hypothetical protein LPJ64_005392 [Coemansia asiatica]KAJ2855696.1 hypothetical protein J3B02_002029 [Coemansia erecta]